MKIPVFSKQFQRDYKRMKKMGKNFNNFEYVVKKLLAGEKLEKKFCDHPLKGQWIGCRDCHIQSDGILIYETTETKVYFFRTGTHSELFN